MKTTLTRTAPDISCEHCARAIESALTALDGVRRVEVDVGAKRVDVRFDDGAATPEQIDAVLEAEGYPPA